MRGVEGKGGDKELVRRHMMGRGVKEKEGREVGARKRRKEEKN